MQNMCVLFMYFWPRRHISRLLARLHACSLCLDFHFSVLVNNHGTRSTHTHLFRPSFHLSACTPPTAACQAVWKSGNQEIQRSGNREIQKSGKWKIQKSGIQKHKKRKKRKKRICFHSFSCSSNGCYFLRGLQLKEGRRGLQPWDI